MYSEEHNIIQDNSSKKKIALCFSGHIRDFHLCYDTLLKNFIQPLIDAGFEVHSFAAFWDVLGHRNNGWSGYPDFDYFKQKLKPKALIVEPFNRAFYIQKYTTNQWKTRRHLSCLTTSGDAVSMWCSIYKCFEEIEKYQTDNNFTYDVICRVRPDLLYNTPLDMKEIEDIMTRDVIYIPKWRGKYYEICHEIVDYFGMGNFRVMKHYLSTFLNIPTYLGSDEYIHTAEGYLLAQLKGYTIERTNIQFSVRRIGYIENVMC